MNRTAYTYRVVKYVHDPVAGEALNVGVLLFSASPAWVGFRYESRYRRLSQTFSDFHGDAYRSPLARIARSVDRLNDELNALISVRAPTSLAQITRLLVPDTGLRFQFGEILSGVSTDVERALEKHFKRLVDDQAPAGPESSRRDDSQVWSHYERALRENLRANRIRFTEKVFQTPGLDYRAEHAFKNGAWHVLHPLSLDYKDPSSVQKRATQVVGLGVGLEGHPELGVLYLLLGRPATEHSAYSRAKALLAKMPVEHRIIEESQADSFAAELAEYVQAHEPDDVDDKGG